MRMPECLSTFQRFDLDLNNQLFIILFPYVWNPFKNILMTFETFLMMSITTERYLAIKNPLEYRLGKVIFRHNRVTIEDDWSAMSNIICLIIFWLIAFIDWSRFSSSQNSHWLFVSLLSIALVLLFQLCHLFSDPMLWLVKTFPHLNILTGLSYWRYNSIYSQPSPINKFDQLF